MVESDQTSTPLFKKCSHCKIEKPLSEFGKDKNGRNGLTYQCKICRKGRDRKESDGRYRQKPESKKRRKLIAQSGKGQISKMRSNFRWYWSHRETNLEQGRLYRLNNWEAYYNRKRELYYQHQDKYGCHSSIGEWYPAARLIEALSTAPIVEIKI